MNRALLIVALAAALAACGPSAPSQAPKSDPTAEGWYPQETQRLARMDRTAEQFFQERQDAASRRNHLPARSPCRHAC